MIFPRPRHLAVILLVLLCVISAMGKNNDENYRIYKFDKHPNTCLSFKNVKNPADKCVKCDPMQKIYITKTGISGGIFHSGNKRRILCYHEKKRRFFVYRFKQYNKQRHRMRHHKKRGQPGFSLAEQNTLRNPRPFVSCELHETGHQFYYISAKPNSTFLSIGARKVRRIRMRGGKVIEPNQRSCKLLNVDGRTENCTK